MKSMPLEDWGFPGCVLFADGTIEKPNGRIVMSPYENGSVSLPVKTGVHKSVKLARLVAEAFIPNPNNYKYVGFRDEIITNCHMDNLFWTSKKKRTIITEEQKFDMSQMYGKGYRVEDIAISYGVSAQAVRAAIRMFRP